MRLRPLRVLVVSPDGRFRTVMSLLLARHNCVVTTTPSAARVLELIMQESTDVVVIEDGRQPAAKIVACWITSSGRLARCWSQMSRAPVHMGAAAVAKWGPFEELLEAIEGAERSNGRASREATGRAPSKVTDRASSRVVSLG